MLGSYWSPRDINYPILGTPAKHPLKKTKMSVKCFGDHCEHERYTRIVRESDEQRYSISYNFV